MTKNTPFPRRTGAHLVEPTGDVGEVFAFSLSGWVSFLFFLVDVFLVISGVAGIVRVGRRSLLARRFLAQRTAGL